jgi:hypothetical protein
MRKQISTIVAILANVYYAFYALIMAIDVSHAGRFGLSVAWIVVAFVALALVSVVARLILRRNEQKRQSTSIARWGARLPWALPLSYLFVWFVEIGINVFSIMFVVYGLPLLFVSATSWVSWYAIRLHLAASEELAA